MGQKVNPLGFRVGISKPWRATWFAEGPSYSRNLLEDVKIRRLVQGRFKNAGIDRIETERDHGRVKIIIYSSKPGIIIGAGGQNIEKLRLFLQTHVKSEILVNIQSIQKPDLSSPLVAQNIARQLEDRRRFRRTVKQALQRVIKAGAKGCKIRVKGRLDGNEMSRQETVREGRVPLHTLRADIDFGQEPAKTTYGVVGVTVWIYRGDVAHAFKGN